MKANAVAAAVVVSTLIVLMASCAEVDRPTCYAGDYLACGCANGARGFQACGADGEYAACVCDGRVPGLDAGSALDAATSDAAPEAAVIIGDSGKRAFMSACTTNDECETGLCQAFGARGSFCSRACTAATASTDCPPPSTGCNNNGVCRAP